MTLVGELRIIEAARDENPAVRRVAGGAADRIERYEAVLREIIAVRKARHLYQCEQDEDMATIARRALGEE